MAEKKGQSIGKGSGFGMSYDDGEFYNEADYFGNAFRGEDRKKKEKETAEALKKLDGLYTDDMMPEFSDYNPEDFKWNQDYLAESIGAGNDVNYEGIDPRLADVAEVDRSDMNNVSVDPRLKDTQMASLSALEDIANSGGLTMADKAALNSIQSEVGQADRGRRDAIKQNMAMRGMGGSGMELLQMLDSSQDATTRANQSGMDIAGMAQQRALDALMSGGNMAGNIRNQDFGEQSRVAEANDVIARFNAQNTNQGNQFNAGAMNNANQFNAGNQLKTDMYNRDTNIGVNQFNANTRNDANKFNITGAQNTANANTESRNNAQLQNNFTAPQQAFQNKMGIQQGKANVVGTQIGAKEAAQNRQAQQDAQTMESGGKIAGAAISAFSDEKVKKDISHVSPEEIHEFLTAVQPKKFKYKNPEVDGQAEGDRVGFMLQDVQGTKLGKAITKKDENGLMKYDKDNLNGIILAALSSLAKGAA